MVTSRDEYRGRPGCAAGMSCEVGGTVWGGAGDYIALKQGEGEEKKRDGKKGECHKRASNERPSASEDHPLTRTYGLRHQKEEKNTQVKKKPEPRIGGMEREGYEDERKQAVDSGEEEVHVINRTRTG